MRKRLAAFVLVIAASVAPVAVARPASACTQCEEQAVLGAIRCMGSGPFWMC